jgi:cell division septum initiation protein DivIVA
MNVHETIDRIEYLVTHGRRIPLTRSVAIDEDEAMELLDALRLNLPDEIKQARWTVQESQRLLAEAQAEAARLTGQATDRALNLISQHELVRRADKQAEALLRDATQRAEEIRRSADAYVLEVMQNLETQLLAAMGTVKKGLEVLRPERTEAQAAARR